VAGALKILCGEFNYSFFWTGLQDFSGWTGLNMSLVFNPGALKTEGE
jgi:hypothetical protein